MNLLRDEEFRRILLRFLIKDRNFLKTCGHLLSAEDFKPTAQSDGNETWLIASWALDYYRERGEPIGGLLRTEAMEKADTLRFGSKQTARLLAAVKELQNPATDVIAADAVQEKVVAFKKSRAKQRAMEKLVELQERGELTDERWYEVTTEANRMFEMGYKITDFMSDDEFKKRALRRADEQRKHRRPFLLIDEIDRMYPTGFIGRGMLGVILGYLKAGKSLALDWVTLSLAWQGMNVLHFALEDPANEVEDRLDAAITHLPINRLGMTPIKLRKRFERMRHTMHGRLKVIDGTEGGMSVQRMDEIYERERNLGFYADAIVCDYDDEVEPPRKQKDRRFEFADIYRDYRRLVAKRSLFGWMGAQTNTKAEGKRVITASNSAEDISKIRKATITLGIGDGEWGDDSKYLSIVASKIGRQKIGCNIMTKYEQGLFYDRDATLERMAQEEGGRPTRSRG